MDDVTQAVTPEQIVDIVRSHRFDLSNEKRMQGQLAQVLIGQGIGFSREHRLSAKDIPDFMVGRTAVECKLRGQTKMGIYKQLKRYAAHDSVEALVLVTNVSMGMPDEIEGKPVYFATLSRGWI